MRRRTEDQEPLFSYVGLESYVPNNQPLRRVQMPVDGVLDEMDEEPAFPYADVGRPSIPPDSYL